jgi:hypothetical protein
MAEWPVECDVSACPKEELGINGLKVDAGLRGVGWKGEVGDDGLFENGSLSKGLLKVAEPPVDCDCC